jgi:hypothetical protein
MLAIVTIRNPGKCMRCKAEFSIGETAFQFPWRGKKVIACDLCTEQCLPTLYPSYQPSKGNQ